jgi:hypothetical protein
VPISRRLVGPIPAALRGADQRRSVTLAPRALPPGFVRLGIEIESLANRDVASLPPAAQGRQIVTAEGGKRQVGIFGGRDRGAALGILLEGEIAVRQPLPDKNAHGDPDWDPSWR